MSSEKVHNIYSLDHPDTYDNYLLYVQGLTKFLSYNIHTNTFHTSSSADQLYIDHDYLICANSKDEADQYIHNMTMCLYHSVLKGISRIFDRLSKPVRHISKYDIVSRADEYADYNVSYEFNFYTLTVKPRCNNLFLAYNIRKLLSFLYRDPETINCNILKDGLICNIGYYRPDSAMSKMDCLDIDHIKNLSPDDLIPKCRNLGIRSSDVDHEHLIYSIKSFTDNIYFTRILYSIETFSPQYIQAMEYLLDKKYINRSALEKINLHIDETQKIINKLERKLNNAKSKLENLNLIKSSIK